MNMANWLSFFNFINAGKMSFSEEEFDAVVLILVHWYP